MPGSEKSGAGEPMASGAGWSARIAGAPACSETAASAAAAAPRVADRRLIRNILLSFRADRSGLSTELYDGTQARIESLRAGPAASRWNTHASVDMAASRSGDRAVVTLPSARL